MEPSLLFFQAYLFFVSHFQLCAMLVMWWLLHKAFEWFMASYQADSWEFKHSRELSRFTIWMVVWLFGSIFMFLGSVLLLERLLEDSAIALRIAAILPIFGYPVLILVLLGWDGLLGSFWRITWDALSIWKPGGLTFRDGFVADIPTSLTRALSDYTYSWFTLIYGDQDVISEDCKGLWVDPTMCGDHWIAASLAMALPYLIRLYQCLGGAWYADSKGEHLLNATKYAAFLLGLILSGLQASGQISRTLYLIFACIISGYATVWDIVGDWQLHQGPSDGPNLHIVQWVESVHKWVFFVWVCPIDALLRFSWLYTLKVKAPYSSITILIIALLEILRRCQWAYFCVERGAIGYYDEESQDPLWCVRTLYVEE